MNIKKKLTPCFLRTVRFTKFIIDHFFEDDVPYRASALAFTSLLAIVPFMAVGFTILSSFPVFQDFGNTIQDFIFSNFVPTTGKVVQGYLQQFALQVTNLSIFGIMFLFITALLLMVTIESAMNKIWRVSAGRKGVPAFLLYWAILSLLPIFLCLSLAASSYLISFPFFKDHQAPSVLLSILPLLLSIVGFTFLYVVVPNCAVKCRHGFIGGVFSALLIESAKNTFAFYLSRYNSYQLLYGAFATIPIFFVWVYWVWFITLLGAEISYALSVHHKRRAGEPLDGYSHALLWLEQLWIKQQLGEGMSLNELIDASKQPFMVDSEEMIKVLKKLHLIHNNKHEEFFLSRDLDSVSLYWLSKHLPYPLPKVEQFTKKITHPLHAWVELFKKNDEMLKESLEIGLGELFSNR